MASITDIADKFFVACETGKGWEACKTHCTPGATFSAQAEPLSDVTSLEKYCEWMKWLLGPLPDGHYDLKSFATDEKRRNVTAYAVFHGTHTGQGGPSLRPARRWPPTTSTSCNSTATRSAI